MTFLEIDYVDLLLMGAKNLNATWKKIKDSTEGTLGEDVGRGYGNWFNLVFKED